VSALKIGLFVLELRKGFHMYVFTVDFDLKSNKKLALFLMLFGLLVSCMIGCSRSKTHVQHGSSMEPTIPNGARISISSHVYCEQPPPRWELVAFRPPINKNTVFVMRVVGLPGETIQLDKGRLLINGKILSFPRELVGHVISTHTEQIFGRKSPYKIPQGHVFVLGDNSNTANDSRFWGALDQSLIIGRVDRVEPVNTKNDSTKGEGK